MGYLSLRKALAERETSDKSLTPLSFHYSERIQLKNLDQTFFQLFQFSDWDHLSIRNLKKKKKYFQASSKRKRILRHFPNPCYNSFKVVISCFYHVLFIEASYHFHLHFGTNMFAVNATGRISRKTGPNELAKEQQHITGQHEILLLSLIESGWIQ